MSRLSQPMTHLKQLTDHLKRSDNSILRFNLIKDKGKLNWLLYKNVFDVLKTYLGSCQTSMMERFCKNSLLFLASNYFCRKNSSLMFEGFRVFLILNKYQTYLNLPQRFCYLGPYIPLFVRFKPPSFFLTGRSTQTADIQSGDTLERRVYSTCQK